jgi:hypothetical protein
MTTKTIRVIQKLHSTHLSATYLVEYQSSNATLPFKCVLKSFQFGHGQTNKQKSEIQKEGFYQPSHSSSKYAQGIQRP